LIKRPRRTRAFDRRSSPTKNGELFPQATASENRYPRPKDTNFVQKAVQNGLTFEFSIMCYVPHV